MSTRSLQLCWPTLWKLRWGLELPTLVLSPLLDTLHCHLARREETRRERKERAGERREGGRRRRTVILPPHVCSADCLPTLEKFEQSDSRLQIISTIWLVQLQLLHWQAICNHFSPHNLCLKMMGSCRPWKYIAIVYVLPSERSGSCHTGAQVLQSS